MARARMVIAVVACGLLVGCGGGGGQTGSGSPGSDAGPRPLGSRAVPGYALALTQAGPASSGQSLGFELVVTPDAGQAPPTVVEAALSATEPATWIAGTPVAGSAGTWSWVVALPADLAGLRAWIRITDADGNQAMSGAVDFPLAR